jgi:hypothetical protein
LGKSGSEKVRWEPGSAAPLAQDWKGSGGVRGYDQGLDEQLEIAAENIQTRCT